MWFFYFSFFSKSWGLEVGGVGRFGGLILEVDRGFKDKGMRWELGGFEVVYEGLVGCVEGYGDG